MAVVFVYFGEIREATQVTTEENIGVDIKTVKYVRQAIQNYLDTIGMKLNTISGFLS